MLLFSKDYSYCSLLILIFAIYFLRNGGNFYYSIYAYDYNLTLINSYIYLIIDLIYFDHHLYDHHVSISTFFRFISTLIKLLTILILLLHFGKYCCIIIIFSGDGITLEDIALRDIRLYCILVL